MSKSPEAVGREIAVTLMLQELFDSLDKALGSASPGLPATRHALETRIASVDGESIQGVDSEQFQELKKHALAQIDEVFWKITARPAG